MISGEGADCAATVEVTKSRREKVMMEKRMMGMDLGMNESVCLWL
ncbi:MAG: hypothetical protein ACJAWN_001912 [Neolewinella sp.]|jgi:hypothetical protein